MSISNTTKSIHAGGCHGSHNPIPMLRCIICSNAVLTTMTPCWFSSASRIVPDLNHCLILLWRRPNGIRLIDLMKHRLEQHTLYISDLKCSHHRFLLISSRDIEWSVTWSHRLPYTSSWTQSYHTYAYLHRMYMASVASNMYPERVGPGPVTRSPCSALFAWLPCHYKLILIHDNI